MGGVLPDRQGAHSICVAGVVIVRAKLVDVRWSFGDGCDTVVQSSGSVTRRRMRRMRRMRRYCGELPAWLSEARRRCHGRVAARGC